MLRKSSENVKEKLVVKLYAIKREMATTHSAKRYLKMLKKIRETKREFDILVMKKDKDFVVSKDTSCKEIVSLFSKIPIEELKELYNNREIEK